MDFFLVTFFKLRNFFTYTLEFMGVFFKAKRSVTQEPSMVLVEKPGKPMTFAAAVPSPKGIHLRGTQCKIKKNNTAIQSNCNKHYI
ncbi:hypothetical protein XELAEV_18002167mg [Xenopus laevis]|uniref:Uncharacterized protein n=1 Tax=Xenopus laevis TaxID=8355 RepID=A0A974BNL6_XENLA|nr:hypothetical protein XELAEV_18002167mg [Xenopus laevis]